jgi:hypothetical protein
LVTSTYHAGRLVALNHSGRKLVMQFGNNLANQRVTERTLTYDGRLVQSATDRLNCLTFRNGPLATRSAYANMMLLNESAPALRAAEAAVTVNSQSASGLVAPPNL